MSCVEIARLVVGDCFREPMASNHTLNRIVCLVSLGWISWVNLVAQSPQQLEAARAIISTLPAGEIPARCAALVAGAPDLEQAGVACSLIQTVAAKNVSTLRACAIGMVSRVPKVAPAVVGAAVEAQPERAADWIRAVEALPDVQKSEIVAAALGASPQRATRILQARRQGHSSLLAQGGRPRQPAKSPLTSS